MRTPASFATYLDLSYQGTTFMLGHASSESTGGGVESEADSPVSWGGGAMSVWDSAMLSVPIPTRKAPATVATLPHI